MRNSFKYILPLIILFAGVMFFFLNAEAKEKVEIPLDNDVIRQEFFNKENVVYVIRHNYDLKGSVIRIPDNCELEFDGGSIIGGQIEGKVTNDFLCPEWFGAKGDGVTDDRNAIAQCISLCGKVKLKPSTYCLKSRNSHSIFDINGNLEVDGNGAVLLLPDVLYKDYNSSIWLFHDETVKNGYRKNFHDFSIDVRVNKSAEFLGNFYMFNLYSEIIDIKNVSIVNHGKYNNLNGVTICYARDVNLTNFSLDNQSKAKIGGALWVMLKDKPEEGVTTIRMKDCNLVHDAMDETICLSSSGDNKTDCNIKFQIENCKFRSPNEVRGSGFFIFYDKRNEGLYKYNIEGEIKKCSFVSERNSSSPYTFRRIFSTQRGSAVTPSWNILFNDCDFVDSSDYQQVNGENGVWSSNYLFGQPSYSVSDAGTFRLEIRDSRISTKNSVFNPYSGGCAGDISMKICEIKCKALRLGNANPDKSMTNFVMDNCVLNTEFPYSFGGNEKWRNTKVVCDSNNFFLVPFSKVKKLNKSFDGCTFNGESLNLQFDINNKSLIKAYCDWKHPIFNGKSETISGIVATKKTPSGVFVNRNFKIIEK